MNELDFLEQELESAKTVEIIKIAEAAERMAQDTSAKIGSGFADLDGCIDGGFREGDFTVTAGIPGEGKTTAMRMFTLNLAQSGIPSLWFSHEMTYRELWDSFEKMGADKNLISFVPMELESDLEWMLKHIKIAQEKHGVRAVFIDTLGDISVSKERRKDAPNYPTLIEMMCKDIRDFAVKNKILIFAAAHCTKNTKSRTNETENSDIAHSNGIAATATNIFHVWRDTDSDDVSFVKIGKSRRDGTKKGWKFKFRFKDNKLVPEGRHTDFDGEDAWRKI